MLMTSTDLKNLISQVNEAFKGQFNRLSDLEAKVAELEATVNKPKVSPRKKSVNNTQEST